MSDPLENFIKNHKNEFDVFEPSSDLWKKLDERLDAHQKKSKQRSKMSVIYSFGKVAAILFIVLSFGFIWGYYKQKQATNLERINPEYAAKEVQFSSLIEVKRSELKDLKSIDPNLYRTFTSAHNKLEQEYQSLKKQLITTPNQDKVVKAMIRNLQSQIYLLNQQLDITKEVKQIKSKQHEQSI